MKNFLAVYMGSASSPERSKWDALDPAKRKDREGTGMKAWGDWMTKHQAVIVTNGGPLGKTKRASAKGIADFKNAMTGYVVVKAESHDAAAALFANHPHFAIFPGESVEIMEVLPIPGQ
jgi:hypothetical protein